MLSIVLNIVGIILILYSLYVIKRDASKKRYLEDDLNPSENEIGKYYKTTENINDNFEDIMESKINVTDTEIIVIDKDKLNCENKKRNSIINDNRTENYKENTNFLYKKIIDLKTIGLSDEEIAKKLNKGIREVEIVLKMHKNRN